MAGAAPWPANAPTRARATSGPLLRCTLSPRGPAACQPAGILPQGPVPAVACPCWGWQRRRGAALPLPRRPVGRPTQRGRSLSKARAPTPEEQTRVVSCRVYSVSWMDERLSSREIGPPGFRRIYGRACAVHSGSHLEMPVGVTGAVVPLPPSAADRCAAGFLPAPNMLLPTVNTQTAYRATRTSHEAAWALDAMPRSVNPGSTPAPRAVTPPSTPRASPPPPGTAAPRSPRAPRQTQTAG